MIPMSEKYGEIPRPFTREWWSYIWLYYKWRIILVLALIFLISIIVFENTTASKYDLTLTYAVESHLKEELRLKAEEKIQPLCEDINKDGEKLLSFISMDFSKQALKDVQYAAAINMKLQHTVSEDDAYIYIFSKSIVDMYENENTHISVFTPLEKWVDSSVDEELKYKNVAISLENNKLFSELGMDMKDAYLAIRFEPDDDETKRIKEYKAAINLANAILNY